MCLTKLCAYTFFHRYFTHFFHRFFSLIFFTDFFTDFFHRFFSPIFFTNFFTYFFHLFFSPIFSPFFSPIFFIDFFTNFFSPIFFHRFSVLFLLFQDHGTELWAYGEFLTILSPKSQNQRCRLSFTLPQIWSKFLKTQIVLGEKTTLINFWS